jgi:uncharacterized membrane protein
VPRGLRTALEGRPLLVRASAALERATALDGVVDAARPVAARLVSGPARRWVLHGQGLGHAVHPFLTDVPLGAWMSASVLDLAPGVRGGRPAQTLVGTGLLAAVPTVVTGWAEWAAADRETQRVGVVHAGANTVSVVLYGASWLVRRRGRHRTGALLALAGGAVSGVGGYLGGHMAIARNAGTRDRTFVPPGREAAHRHDASAG